MSYNPPPPGTSNDPSRGRGRSRSPRRDDRGPPQSSSSSSYQYPDPYYAGGNSAYGHGYGGGGGGGYDDRNASYSGYDSRYGPNSYSYDYGHRSGGYNDYRYDDYRRDYRGGGGYRDRPYSGGGGGGRSGYSDRRARSPGPMPRKYDVVKGNDKDRATTTTLYVGNLPYHFEERDVRDLFGRYGPLKSVNVPYDRYTRRNKGFSFVEYDERRDAEDALEKLQGWSIDSRKIKLDWDVGLNKKDEIKGRTPGGSSAPGNSNNNDKSYGRNDSGGDAPPGTY